MSICFKQLMQLNSYVTPEGSSSFFSRLFPSLSHYARLLPILLKASWLAGKGIYSSEDWIKSSWDTVRSLELSGARFYVEGLEHIRSVEEPCVFIGNHMSTLETFALPCIIEPHRPVTFVTKDSLLKYPLFGRVLGSRNPIVVGRVSPREDLAVMLREGSSRLEQGVSVIVFPQSTRSFCFDLTQFNSIGVKLARRNEAWIIPVAVKTDVWGMGRFLKDAGPIDPSREVHFRFGAPLKVEGKGKDEHNHICEFISSSLKEWGVDTIPALGPLTPSPEKCEEESSPA
ncbi:MAG: 1-acyl-sn-glycerol-3-phosphate acyltransferase [Desulfovibrionaceae bacterium]|nr:1-acyl-sn-glycerol-3-phosphate acyltransferase [Desulfovibrionaceae bacterium]